MKTQERTHPKRAQRRGNQSNSSKAHSVGVVIKVTMQAAAQRIFAGRTTWTSIDPLAEATRAILSLPVSVALVRARYWQLTNGLTFLLHA